MAGWRITSFDRAMGRGTCASGTLELPFDASVALVDSFAVGEEVDVTLRPDGASFEVTRIQPHAFRAPFDAPTAPHAPDLGRILSEVHGRSCWLAGADASEEEIVLGVDDDSYQPARRLVFRGALWIQMPLSLEIDRLHAFDPEAAAASVPRAWPRAPRESLLFRIDPFHHGEPHALILARTIALELSGPPVLPR